MKRVYKLDKNNKIKQKMELEFHLKFIKEMLIELTNLNKADDSKIF